MTNKALSIFNQLRPVSVGFDSIFDHFEKMFDDDLNYPRIPLGNYPLTTLSRLERILTTLKLRWQATIRRIFLWNTQTVS